MNCHAHPLGMAQKLLLVVVGFTWAVTSFSQGTLEALATSPSRVIGFENGGVGWSFVPISDLLVTAIRSTAPQVNFWLGSNQVIVTYSNTGFDYQAVQPLPLSAGQSYFVSTQNANPNSDPTVVFNIYSRECPRRS